MGSPNPVFPRARLAAAAVLFLGWIGILLLLVIRTRDPVILSRPQLLVSNLVVVAQVHEGRGGGANSEITVTEVLWAAEKDDIILKAEKLDVQDLSGEPMGWKGPGLLYIVPLLKRKEGKGFVLQVTPMPVVPGYHPKTGPDARIYAATPDALAQWRELSGQWGR